MNRPARRRSSYKNIADDQQQPQPTTTATTMDSANRKIELQSPEDLTYLINNARRAAAEHIQAAFPPVEDANGQEEDELRVRIEKLVEEYISQTFTLSAPNLCINGFDLDPKTFPAVYLSDPSSSNKSSKKQTRSSKRTRQQQQPEPNVQYEPYDARKRARVEELARQEEDLMREIAALKRKMPGAAAQGYNQTFWEGVQKDEVALAAAREKALQQFGVAGREAEDDPAAGPGAGEDGDGEGDGSSHKRNKTVLLNGVSGPLDRQAQVQETYAGVVDTLGRLKREMPATVAKMERARVAGEYVITER